MRVYLDTNIVMEYFGHRKLFDSVSAILKASEQKVLEAYISTNSLDTIIYLLGLQLKDSGIHEPTKRQKITNMLKSILIHLDVVSISKDKLINALNDSRFKDIEDSIQYHCAEENDSDYLITINIKHFKDTNDKLKIISPTDFVKEHIKTRGLN